VVTWGGSAGGHLALMAGYAPASFNPAGCTDQPKVAAILDDYGASNVAEALTYHGSMDFTHQWIGLDMPLPREAAPAPVPAATSATTAVAGADNTAPVRPPRAQAPRWPDPTPEVLARAKEVSPMTYIHPGLPPTFIVNGDNDHTYEPTQSYQLKKALDAVGVPNGEDIVVGGGHGNFSAAESQKAMLLSLEFLKANGVLQ
jgi:acetyl esterase/lipase